MANHQLTITAVDKSKGTLGLIESNLTRLNDKTKAVNDSFSALSRNLSTIGTVAGGIFGLATTKALGYAGALNDAAEASGIAITSISALGATLSTNGGAASDAADAANKLADSIGTAAAGSKEAQKAFAAAGVSLNDLRTLSETDIFEKVLKGLAGIPDTATRAAAANNLFGKSLKGVNIQGVSADFDKAKSQQGAFVDSTIAVAKATDSMKSAFTQLQQAIIVAIKPVADFVNTLSPSTINSIITGMVTLAGAAIGLFVFVKIADGVKLLVDGLKLLGGVFAVSGAATAAATAVQGGYAASLAATTKEAAFMAGAYGRLGTATAAVATAQANLLRLQASGIATEAELAVVTNALATAQTRLGVAQGVVATTRAQLTVVEGAGVVATNAQTVANVASTASWYTLGVAIGRVGATLLAIARSPLTVAAGFVVLGEVIAKALDISSPIDIMANKLENFVKNNLPSLYKGIQKAADMLGIAATTIPTSELRLAPTGAGGGRGRGGATADELMGAGRATQGPITRNVISATTKEKTALEQLMETYKKTNATMLELGNARSKGIKDGALNAAIFAAESQAAQQLGLTLQKPISLIGRDFAIANNIATEAIRQEGYNLENTAAQATQFANEIAAATQALDKQEARLANTTLTTQRFANELRSSALALTENEMKLADASYQATLFNQEITKSNQTLAGQVTQLNLAEAAYTTGGISQQQYLTILGGVNQELLTTTQRFALMDAEMTKNNATSDLNARYLGQIERQFAAGTISLDAYTQAWQKFNNGLEITPLPIVIDQAAQAAKRQGDLAAQASQLNDQLKIGAIGWKQYGAAVKIIGEEYFPNYTKQVQDAKSLTEVLNETIDSGTKKATDALTTNLTNAIRTGKGLMSSFKDFFNQILTDIANAIIQKQFVNPIVNSITGMMGGGGGGGGGIGSWFSNLFKPDYVTADQGIWAGMFADGGTIGAGQIGIAGEMGPELITGPAKVVPMDKMGGSVEPIVVNLNLSAIDTRSGIEFLVQNRAAVTGIVQDAFNRRGKTGFA